MKFDRGVGTLAKSSPLLICALFLAAGWALLFGSVGISQADKLTLQESVDLALKNNPAVNIAGEGVRKADAIIDESSVPGRPTVRLDADVQRIDQVPLINFNGVFIPATSLYSRRVDLVFLQAIDAFGAIKAGKRAARYEKQSYLYGYDQQVNDTTLDVKTAYFNVLRSQQYLKVQEDAVDQINAHLKDAQANYKAGTIPKFDVLRAETELENGRQGLISAQNGVKLAKAAFNNTLGRALDTPVDLTDPGTPEVVNLQLPQCINSACEFRPEVLRASTQVAYCNAMVKEARLQSKPTFNLKWDYNQNLGTNTFDTRSNSWRAIITSSYPIYDGGATRAAVKKAESDSRNARSMEEQAKNGVMLDAQQSYLNLQEAGERIKAAEKALEEAKESNRLAEERFKAGITTQVEVLDAQTALTLARANHVNALYDYYIALAKLEHAVGGKTEMAKLLNEKSPQSVAKK